MLACGFGMLEGSSLYARYEFLSGLIASHLLGEVELQLTDHLSLLLLHHAPTSRTRNLLNLPDFGEQIEGDGEREGCWGGEFGSVCDEGSGAVAEELPLELLIEGTAEVLELVGVGGGLLIHKFIYYSTSNTTKFPRRLP